MPTLAELVGLTPIVVFYYFLVEGAGIYDHKGHWPHTSNAHALKNPEESRQLRRRLIGCRRLLTSVLSPAAAR